MKNRGNIFVFCLLLASVIIMNSCVKENNGKTIALVGTEYYIDSLLSVIPDSIQEKFITVFGAIPEGPIPPKVEGSYVVESNMLVSNNQHLPTPSCYPNAYVRFSEQHNGIAVMDLYDGDEQRTDTVFVMGNATGFMVYCMEDKVVEGMNYNMERGVMIGGKIRDEGIAEFTMAFIVKKVDGEGQGNAPSRGSYYIYKDNDGLAARCEWPWQ